MNKFLKLTFSFCACFSLIFSLNVISQEIEEVVVTATKKEESIQDLAVSVEAFTAEDMDNNMVEDFSDLAEIVPGLIIDKAINEISEFRGKIGAFQKNDLESNLNYLRNAHENVTNAESVIRDADMAEEMTKFTRNQIMIESSTAMLAQANQTPKSILKLLG